MTRVRLIQLGVVCGAILVLELLCRLGIIDRFTMIPPSEMIGALVRVVATAPWFWPDVSYTLGNLAAAIPYTNGLVAASDARFGAGSRYFTAKYPGLFVLAAEDVSRRLAEHGVFASHGDFYDLTCIERLGVDALVRAGCACYTTDEEVERLISGVEALA